MANHILKIQPIGTSTQYDIRALTLRNRGRLTNGNINNSTDDHNYELTTFLRSSSMTTGQASFDSFVLNCPWDWGAYGGQVAIGNTTTTPRMQIRSAVNTDNGEGASPRYSPNWGSWREVLTGPAATAVGSSTGPIYINASGQATACGSSLAVSITGNAATSSSCTGNAASATKLQTARNIWGKSFNGTADISGDMTNVGPGMYLPSGQSRFQFLTSGGGAGNGYFGKVGCCGTYATIDSNIGSHSFYNNGTSRVDGTIYRPNSTLGNSWVGSRGLPYSVIAVDASDSTSSVAYTLEAIKFQTNTYGMCAERAGETYGITGWKNSRTANGYDAYFYISKDCYFRCSTRVYGAVWNDYAEKRNIPEAQQDWIDEECAANPLAGRCVREIGDDTMVLSDARMQKGCKIISDTFGFSIGETEDCKTPIAVSGRVLAYLLEGREVAKEHIGDFVCSGPNGTVSIMTTEEYFKCPQAVVGTISAVPDYEVWGTGNVKVDGRIWIYVR